MNAALIALWIAAAPDPCAGPALAGAAGDPSTAAAYREVGDAERVAGALETAARAYRRAAEADPSDARARESLAAACAERGATAAPADPFRQGVRRMEAGDAREAAELFAAARSRSDDPSAALLEGICRYELGEDAAAEPLLHLAESAPEHRDTARLYLGLLALRRGATADAAARFDSVSGNPALASLASDLARAARRDGRLVLSFSVESGWDSNVNLGAGGAAGAAPRRDAMLALGGSALWRPGGQDGPYLRATGSLREQARLGAYDLGAAGGAAGWQWVGHGAWALAEYDLGYQTLAGDSFLTSHRALATGAVGGGRWSLGGAAFARYDRYAGVYDPFSGGVVGGELRASRALGSRARATLAYGAARAGARTSILAYVEHGPRAELRLDLSRRLRLGAAVAWTSRRYESFDEALAARRADTLLDGSALAEWDLSPRWTARLSLAARRAGSNVGAFEYSRMVPTFGLAYVRGW